jgi:hypothetical protein
MASQSEGGSIVVSPVDGLVVLRAGLRARRGALAGGDGMSSSVWSAASALTELVDIDDSIFVATTRLRFREGAAAISSMSRIVGLDSFVEEAKANWARDDLVTRLGGEIGSDTRSNSFEASLDTLEVRILELWPVNWLSIFGSSSIVDAFLKSLSCGKTIAKKGPTLTNRRPQWGYPGFRCTLRQGPISKQPIR